MKTIFLDFDGVLLTRRTCLAGGTGWTRTEPDYTLMRLLHRCGEAGVKMVISSAHRTRGQTHCFCILDYYSDQFTLSDYVLTDWHTVDAMKVGSLFTSMSRKDEIEEYLKRHEEVNDYVILDDEDHGWTEEQRRRWIQCDPENGLQADQMAELVNWAGLKKEAS